MKKIALRELLKNRNHKEEPKEVVEVKKKTSKTKKEVK